MTSQPVRIAVISARHLVRTALTVTFAEVPTRTLVTASSAVPVPWEDQDLAIYDLDVADPRRACADLERLSEGCAVLALLVSEGGDHVLPTSSKAETITLSATPEELESLLGRVVATAGWTNRPHRALPHDLSDRELEVIELIASGLSNEEIGRRLYLSINSVKTYVRQAYRKIGVRDRQAAMRWALDRGAASGRARG